MAYSLIPDIEKDLHEDGWVLERPFLPFDIGDGHFLAQTRVRGGAVGETFSSILEAFNDSVLTGRS